MTWRWITFWNEDGFLAPVALAPAIVEAITYLGGHFRADEPASNPSNFDLPGMCTVDRPCKLVVFAGLALRIPSEDIYPIILRLDEHVAIESGPCAGTIRLGGFLRSILMEPEQRDEFLAVLRAGADEAEARAAAFYADKPTPQELLRAAQPQATPDCFGLDKHGRFGRRGRA